MLSLAASRLEGGGQTADEDAELVARVRNGDERAFIELVQRHHGTMLRLARSFVSSPAVAEEAVQDTWIGVLRGIGGFTGRSSFKTWLIGILLNRARSTAAREGRSVAIGESVSAVDPARFDSTGAWATPSRHWAEECDDRMAAGQLSERLWSAMEAMPIRQRQVVMLRELGELGSGEVCEVLAISPSHQRVLLHRGRSYLRQALENEMGA